MQRREFLAASATAALGLAMGETTTRRADAPADKYLIEIRYYHFASLQKQQAYEQFLAEAQIPALNRAGVEPVGAFKLLAKDNPALKLTEDSTDLYIILPHKTPASLIDLESRLAADEVYQKAGAAILNAPKSDLAYLRYESRLLSAFDMHPKIDVPTLAPDRLIQLRTYESFSRAQAILKLHMFQQGGELTIFHRCGMNGVFFGECLIGDKLPNLTYMLSFENDAAQKKGWAAFRDDPDWKKLSQVEAYKDTVSHITNLLLRPTKGSQI